MNNGLFVALAVAVLVLTPTAASAGKSYAVVNGRSYHMDSSYSWNENNFGLGLEHEFEQRSAWKKVVMANGFRDSNDEMSWMAGVGLHHRLYETEKLAGLYVYAGINAFLMTREETGGAPFPGVLPNISIGTSAIGVNLTYLPRRAVEKVTNAQVVDPTLSGILFLQFKVRLEKLMP